MAKCPNCGANVNDSDKRCSKCGAKLEEGSIISTKLIIGIIAVIAVVAVAGIFVSGMHSNDDSAVPVSDNSNVQNTTTQVSDNQTSSEPQSSSSDSSSSSGVYWASSKSDKFHSPDCEWAQKISGSNKIVYSSRDEAVKDGKIPCSVCNP